MRVLLDAHISSRRVGRSLERRGHDVLALDQDEFLAALPDEQVLEAALAEKRVLITRNVRDFVPILREWAETGRTHRGCILVTLRLSSTAATVRATDALFEAHPTQNDWVDLAAWVGSEVGQGS